MRKKRKSPFSLFTTISCMVWMQAALFIIHAEAVTEEETYTYALSQSSASVKIWTTLPSERVFKDDEVPPENDDEIKVYAAKNEFEPFQVVVKPMGETNVTVNLSDFGAGIESEIYQVKYVNITQASDILGQTGDYPDPLWPIEKGATIHLSANENVSFWFSLKIPETTPAGDYTATVSIASFRVPVALHVFNFSIPNELHVKSQMNFSHNTLLQKYGVSGTGSEYWMYVDKIKQYFIDHRLTPKGVLWSGGLTSSGGGPYIDYDCQTYTFTDNDGIWGFEDPAERYLDGTGLMQGIFTQSFNHATGFPSFMAMTFQNNDASQDQRPATFCGKTRSSVDWYSTNNPTSAYNQAWFTYITAVRDYLSSNHYLSKAYYYFANEPQNQDDYDAVAWYSKHLKAAASNLQLMVSENPRSEIYNHSDYISDQQIDIWLPVLHAYDPVISWDREKNHGEESWVYFLYGTRPPYFNPITLDHPGIESKFTGWFLWKYRLRGLAYYSLNNWSKNPWTDPMVSNHNGDWFMLYPPSEANAAIAYGSNQHRFVPSIRFELMRDSLEDYEYLYRLNSNNLPIVEQTNSADTQADKIITGVASYTRDSHFMYNVRRLIGLKIGGEISEIPDLQPPVKHPRSKGLPDRYYINFQNPDGEPYITYTEDTYGNGHTNQYVTYAGHDYLQVGTEQYDETAGYGWLDDTVHFLWGRDPWGSESDERKITYVYDNWAHHPSIFEFDVPVGQYNIEVSVGTPRVVRSHNRLVIEGVTFIDDEPSNMYIVRSNQVTITDHKLTVDIGIWNEYTMINYLNIEPVMEEPPPGPPAWWTDWGVVNTNAAMQDYAAANMGQLKWIATRAYEEFKANLTNDCSIISNLVTGFSTIHSYSAVNLGQLKMVAQPFYDLLTPEHTNAWPIGMTVGPYPWSGSTHPAQDYSVVNLGQLKYVFSFESP